MLVFRAGIRIVNREDPDQTALEAVLLYKQSDLGLRCLSMSFGWTTSVQNFRTFTIVQCTDI